MEKVNHIVASLVNSKIGSGKMLLVRIIENNKIDPVLI